MHGKICMIYAIIDVTAIKVLIFPDNNCVLVLWTLFHLLHIYGIVQNVRLINTTLTLLIRTHLVCITSLRCTNIALRDFYY
jgi:hypothetical protein